MNQAAGRSPDHVSSGGSAPPSAAERRRRLDEIFGDVLPEVTGDERDPARSEDDGWYLENRPPHHG